MDHATVGVLEVNEARVPDNRMATLEPRAVPAGNADTRWKDAVVTTGRCANLAMSILHRHLAVGEAELRDELADPVALLEGVVTAEVAMLRAVGPHRHIGVSFDVTDELLSRLVVVVTGAVEVRHLVQTQLEDARDAGTDALPIHRLVEDRLQRFTIFSLKWMAEFRAEQL